VHPAIQRLARPTDAYGGGRDVATRGTESVFDHRFLEARRAGAGVSHFIRRPRKADIQIFGANHALPVRRRARARADSSSRTFPGQAYAASRAVASASRRAGRQAAPGRETLDEPCARTGRSSARSRKGGTLQHQHLQAPAKVRPEPVFGDEDVKVAVRCGDHADVDRPFFEVPDGADRALLETRKSFACSAYGMSPISSRKTVPRSARRNRPGGLDRRR
jgi:hypothetical protein